MSSTLNRRAILAGVAAAPALAVPVGALGSTATADNDARIEQLWNERTKLVAESQKLSRAYDTAYAQLPEWAASGPQYLRSNGDYFGTEVGWPRMKNCAPPTPGTFRNVRPSPYEYRERFESEVNTFGREAALRAYKRRMAELRNRLHQQRAEKAKLGLPQIEKQSMAVVDRLIDVEKTIEGIPTLSPTNVAALLMLALSYADMSEMMENENSRFIRAVLLLIRPQLSGLIARHVDDLIEHPGVRHGEREFYPA